MQNSVQLNLPTGTGTELGNKLGFLFFCPQSIIKYKVGLSCAKLREVGFGLKMSFKIDWERTKLIVVGLGFSVS